MITKRDGVAYVGETRVPVWVIAELIQLDATHSNILGAYPFLDENVLLEICYYIIRNFDEIMHEIRTNKDA